MYKPETNCASEKAIRAEMARENYAGHWQAVTKLCADLNVHRKKCAVCQGVPLADILFGQEVTVVNAQAEARR